MNLTTGHMKQCYCGLTLDNIYANIEKPLHFKAIGCNCELAHCYAHVSNRTDAEGREWLRHDMKEFLNQRLYDNNEEYDISQKEKVNREVKRKITVKRKIIKALKIAKSVKRK